MEYFALSSIKYYNECKPIVEGLGYAIVELKVIPEKSQYKVRVVITHLDNDSEGIGINDCSKVHRVLLQRFELLLNSSDVYMEVTSPGMERNIKNAAEFPLFIGKMVRVWDSDITDWVSGTIVSADTKQITLDLVKTTDISSNTESNNTSRKSFSFDKLAKAKLLHI